VTGPEHYRLAEDKLRQAHDIAKPGSGHTDEDAMRLIAIGLARAQVHATLALAAAHVAGLFLHPDTQAAWDAAAGTTAGEVTR
jgi:hypothetical protein